ncbi:MAG: hypothetical protein U0359_34575 [Byssovorax sp.]
MLSVFGLGMVSAAGPTARHQVFVPRAEGPPPSASPFVGLDDRRIDLRSCPWVGGIDAPVQRMLALAQGAIGEAITRLPEAFAASLPRFVVLPSPRPGLGEAELDALAKAIGGPRAQRFSGAAAAFAALAQIAEKSRTGAVLIAVDSLASVEALSERVARPPSPWTLDRPFPAEGAAALLVAAADQGTRIGLPSLGEIEASLAAMGQASDDDDLPVDGAAMTGLLRRLPFKEPIRTVFGQSTVGLLRLRDFQYASARCVDRFSPEVTDESPEWRTGDLGAAAGAYHLALGFAVFHHGAGPVPAPAPFLAWAMSRDGLRGVAIGRAAPSPASALRPLASMITARTVDRVAFAPAAPAAEEDDPWESFAGDEQALLAALGGDADNDRFPAFPSLPETIAPVPLVRLDPERAAPISRADFERSVVDHAAELAAALGRDRFEGPFRRRAETEARLFRQLDAIVASGPRAVLDLLAFWERAPADPWVGFAAALGLACFAGGDAMEAIAHGLDLVPPDAIDPAVTIPEALALPDHPGLADLGRSLSAAASPVVRAVGLGLRSARGDLPLAAITAALADPAEAVARAAIWAAEHLAAGDQAAVIPLLRARLGAQAPSAPAPSASPALLWSAARLLVLWGDLEVWKEGTAGSLADRLGASAAELFVLRSAPAEWPRLEALLGRHKASRALLSSVARFGHPASIPWLLQHLGDEALAEHAAAGLATMLGPIVAPQTMLDRAAWQRAIAALSLDPTQRHRRGRPWSAATVAAECRAGELSRVELGKRLDELSARTGQGERPDLGGLLGQVEPALFAFLDAAARRG